MSTHAKHAQPVPKPSHAHKPVVPVPVAAPEAVSEIAPTPEPPKVARNIFGHPIVPSGLGHATQPVTNPGGIGHGATKEDGTPAPADAAPVTEANKE